MSKSHKGNLEGVKSDKLQKENYIHTRAHTHNYVHTNFSDD